MTARAISRAFLAALGLAAASRIADADSGTATIRFLEQRLENDPLDSVSHTRLSTVCINRMRETGDLSWLDRALQSARASLAAVPAAQNPGGVVALAVAEFESHHFREALALAQQAYATDPRNTSALATAGDAQLELGSYADAERIYQQLGASDSSPPIRARLARLAELKGDNRRAIELLAQAVSNVTDTAWYHMR